MSLLDVTGQIHMMTEDEIIKGFMQTNRYEDMNYWFRRWCTNASCDEETMIKDVVRMTSFGHYYSTHASCKFDFFDLELFVRSILNKYVK